MRVSGSERLSDSHKIFITIKIFDSMKKETELKIGMAKGKCRTVTTKDVEQRMIVLRKQPVLLDTDVAELYGVETKV